MIGKFSINNKKTFESMKKSFVFAMMSAIALTGAVSLTSCSSSEDVTEVNPTYDGESVKTSFTISIGDVKTPTRMVADAVQEPQLFKGMTDIYLFPFKAAVTTSNAASTTIDESYIHLTDFGEFSSNVVAANGRIYNDITLSVGVNNFLFYGAIASSSQGNGKLKPSYLSMTDESWANGFTTWAPSPVNKGATKVGDLTFDLVPIKRGWTIDNVKTEGAATIAPLNAADAALTEAIGAITGTSAAETAAKTKLQEIQKTLRNDVSANTTPDYHAYAGSSNSIKELMEMLYNTLQNLAGTVLKNGSNSYGDGVITAIESSFTPTQNITTGEYTLAWTTNPNFPASLGVPDGAAAVQYVAGSTNAFNYVTTSVDGLAVPAISNYTYPARLYYTVNTPAMVKDDVYLDQTSNATKTWEDIKSDGGYSEGAVTAATRSVIMKDQVQYAVGRLDVQVRVKPETIINDNSEGGEQPVSVPSGGYKLTGVLIGGQKQVGWDFTPISSATEMTIWDNVMAGSSDILAKQQAAYSDPNYTLALETAADTPINIALEFENTGNDFCGVEHNLIPAGTKFYLVAQLKPQDKTGTTPGNWTATGEAGLNQVFKQDYITTALLTINENSLKSAYNVVPDLRSPKLEFGLSVNLEWRKGLTFEIEF